MMNRSVKYARHILGSFADMIARMKLNMIMSDVGWGLWAAIQANISPIDFDFWGWAIERWGRAKKKWTQPSSQCG